MTSEELYEKWAIMKDNRHVKFYIREAIRHGRINYQRLEEIFETRWERIEHYLNSVVIDNKNYYFVTDFRVYKVLTEIGIEPRLVLKLDNTWKLKNYKEFRKYKINLQKEEEENIAEENRNKKQLFLKSILTSTFKLENLSGKL